MSKVIKGTWTLGAAILALALFSIAAVAWAQPPQLPHAFYGALTIGDALAPAGTYVEARAEGVRLGVKGNPITTAEEGVYGGPAALDPKLVVQGDIQAGAPLEFYVNGVRAQVAEPGGEWQDTFPWETGGITELDIRAEELGPTPTPLRRRPAA